MISPYKSKDISFLISTNRDPHKFVNRVIFGLNQNGKNSPFSYEICVFSPMEIKGPNVRWFQEIKSSGGGLYGYNYLAQKCWGKYVVVLTDDMDVQGTVFLVPQLFASPVMQARKYKLFGFGHRGHISVFCPNDKNPTEFGYPSQLVGSQTRTYENSYPVVCFPCLDIDTINNHLEGYIFHPDFVNHYADNYMGFWLTEMGEKPIFTKDIWLEGFCSNASDFTHDDKDYKAFCRRIDRFYEGKRNYIN